MRIVYHIGAHCTDEGLLVKSLRRNTDRLARHGILIPDPSVYRPILRDTADTLKGLAATEQTEDVVLDAVLDGLEGQHAVFSHENFVCAPRWVFGRGPIYPQMGEKAARLRNVFPRQDVSFFMAMRDPATLVPAVFARQQHDSDFDTFLSRVDLGKLSWVPVIRDLRRQVPDAELVVWCNEDTPLIWPDLLMAICGAPEDVILDGFYDLLDTIMTEEGITRMKHYLATHPPRDLLQRRRVTAAFLDKFAMDDAIEIEMDLPGWSVGIVDTLSEHYERDLETIAGMDGVRVIVP